MAQPKRNLSNKTFGKLKVKDFSHFDPKQGACWTCICECGSQRTISAQSLIRSNSKSCGCVNKVRISNLNRKAPGESAKNKLFLSYVKGAKRRNLQFCLSKDEFYNLTQQNCHYCGVVPSNSTKTINPNSYSHILYNGIDRLNNDLGYTLENCISCCKQCNFAKYEQTYSEFMSYIDRLVNFHVTKNLRYF